MRTLLILASSVRNWLVMREIEHAVLASEKLQGSILSTIVDHHEYCRDALL